MNRAREPNGRYAKEPAIEVGVREYVDKAIAVERVIAQKDLDAVYVKFATIEAARLIAKEEVEDARERMAADATRMAEATAKLVESKTRSEGVSGVRNWIAPSGTAMVGGLLGVLGFVVAVLAILVK